MGCAILNRFIGLFNKNLHMCSIRVSVERFVTEGISGGPGIPGCARVLVVTWVRPGSVTALLSPPPTLNLIRRRLGSVIKNRRRLVSAYQFQKEGCQLSRPEGACVGY